MTDAANLLDSGPRRAHTLAVTGVVSIWAGIALWLAHLGSMAALVGLVSNEPHLWWAYHVDTGICAFLTILCILWSLRLAFTGRASPDDGTYAGRTVFLGWQGVLAGLANLALILAEGMFVAFLWPGHGG
jgi:hypothetical protein